MYEFIIMKQKKKNPKKTLLFKENAPEKIGELMIHRGHFSEGSCVTFVLRCLYEVRACVLKSWLMCTITRIDMGFPISKIFDF